MNVNKVFTKNYENISNWTLGENKPNTKPIKANLLNAQINVTTFLTKDYENKSNWALGENKANSKPNKANFPAPSDETNPIQTQYKPKQSQFQTAHLLIDRTKSKLLNFLLKNPADTKNPPKNPMPAPYDLFTNNILAFASDVRDNNSRLSIARTPLSAVADSKGGYASAGEN